MEENICGATQSPDYAGSLLNGKEKDMLEDELFEVEIARRRLSFNGATIFCSDYTMG